MAWWLGGPGCFGDRISGPFSRFPAGTPERHFLKGKSVHFGYVWAKHTQEYFGVDFEVGFRPATGGGWWLVAGGLVAWWTGSLWGSVFGSVFQVSGRSLGDTLFHVITSPSRRSQRQAYP